MGVVVVWAGQPSHARESWLAHASHLPNIPYLSCLLVLVPCLLLEAPSCSSLGGLSGPEARRTTSGASGCRGGLQCELRSQPLSPCLVPSCRSPVHVFAYSCALPPTAVPTPILLPKPGSPMFLAAKTLWIPTPQDFPKNSCISRNFVRNVARRRPWRNAGPGETVTAGHVPVSHQDVALFIRSFADLGSESSSARKNPRSRKDTSTVTPSESYSAVLYPPIKAVSGVQTTLT